MAPIDWRYEHQKSARSTATSSFAPSAGTSCRCSGRRKPSSHASQFPSRRRPQRGRHPTTSGRARNVSELRAGVATGDPVPQLRHPGPFLRLRLRPHGHWPRPHLSDLGGFQPRFRCPGLRLGAGLLRLRERGLADLGGLPPRRRRRGAVARAMSWTGSCTASSARHRRSSSS